MSLSNSKARANILFQLSGSIASYKACHVISRLVQAGCDVQVVATRSALEFVGPATLEGLSGRPVASETFLPGAYMHHIHLMKWADLVILCPGTANTINKLASGIGDDLLTTLFLAHDFQKSYLIAPAMNMWMYRHPATQAALTRLKEWGVEILETASGVLACGDVGEGKLLDPDLILEDVLKRLAMQTPSSATAENLKARTSIVPQSSSSLAKPLKILITAGGTQVPIDGVRSITNTSSGATGAVIAEYLCSQGHEITFVHARDSKRPPNAIETLSDRRPIDLIPFVTFEDLDGELRRLLSEKTYDAVIHLAAVSDYRIDSLIIDGKKVPPSRNRKIDSGESLELKLAKNPKILPHLKDYARSPQLTVVGFKLTNGDSAEQRRAAIAKVAAGTDLIVHNDINEISATFHHATLYKNTHAGIDLATRAETKMELAQKLEAAIRELVAQKEKSE